MDVTFPTRDGVTLAADFQPAHEASRGAVILLHMIPPRNNRSNFPERVREAIAALNVAVLNVDRRGAGGSGGVAEDAYLGKNGWLDVHAAMEFLTSDQHKCPIDLNRIFIVGASNGTTSALDYFAARPADLPAPAGMIWLSPGAYTEAQQTIAALRPQIEELPLLWIFPVSETWARAFEAEAVPNWTFLPVENGQHGTRNFDGGATETLVLNELVSWLRAELGAH